MRDKKSTQVRLMYAKLVKSEIPSGFDVHHIDLDANNNEIENLVAIPRDLHQTYHSLIENSPIGANRMLIEVELKPKGFLEKGHKVLSFTTKWLIDYEECCSQISDYIDYRNYKLGLCPFTSEIKYY